MDYILFLAVLPVFFVLYYIYKKDTHKEPTSKLAMTFGFGALMAIPVIIVEVLLEEIFPTSLVDTASYIGLFINVFIAVALVEELFKWLVVRVGNYNKPHFDQSFDAIVYCVFASIGFACIENIGYVLMEVATEGALSGIIVAILRGVLSVPSHAFDAVLMGYFIAKAKMAQVHKQKGKEVGLLIVSLLAPALEHTLYDYLILTESVLGFLVNILMTIVFYVLVILLIRKLSRENQAFYPQVNNQNNFLNAQRKNAILMQYGYMPNDVYYIPNKDNSTLKK